MIWNLENYVHDYLPLYWAYITKSYWSSSHHPDDERMIEVNDAVFGNKCCSTNNHYQGHLYFLFFLSLSFHVSTFICTSASFYLLKEEDDEERRKIFVAKKVINLMTDLASKMSACEEKKWKTLTDIITLLFSSPIIINDFFSSSR